MKSNLKIALPAMVALVLSSCGAEPTLMERAETLQRSILTLDTHVDTPMSLMNPKFDLTELGDGCVDFPKMRAGALDAESFAVFTSQRNEEGYADKMYAKALILFDKIQNIAAENPDVVGIASKPSDFYDLKSQGKLIILPTVENSVIIGEDINRLDTLYAKGARMIGLCHSYNSSICDASSDPKGSVYDGLSPFGEQVVTRLNELGAVIDVSHASDATVMDVFDLSKAPIAASHSSVRAVANSDRNFSDKMLQALKRNGGVIQICILDAYVKNFPDNPKYKAEMDKARKAYYAIDSKDTEARKAARKAIMDIKSSYPDQNATVKDYVDHIDYVVKQIGVEYVGIGTDFDGGGGISDCKDVSQMINITAELLSRGYSDEDIAKIWGGNFLRVMGDAQSLKSRN